MTIEKTETVDVIVESPQTGGYDLILFDGGEIGDEIKRYSLLIDKLTSYANFVVNGQFYNLYPDARGKTIRFCIVCQSAPNEAMFRIEGIKPRNAPNISFPVTVQMADEYLASTALRNDSSNKNAKPKKQKWWQF